jgi:helix-turn-helix protein
MTKEELFTEEDVAEILGVDVQTVRRWTLTGRLKRMYEGFTEEAIRRFLRVDEDNKPLPGSLLDQDWNPIGELAEAQVKPFEVATEALGA